MELIQGSKPSSYIVFTVSPVPLRRTFTGMGLAEANSISKKKLRDAVGIVVPECRQVDYFDSFERVMAVPESKRYQSDGRHIDKGVSAGVVEEFKKEYMA